MVSRLSFDQCSAHLNLPFVIVSLSLTVLNFYKIPQKTFVYADLPSKSVGPTLSKTFISFFQFFLLPFFTARTWQMQRCTVCVYETVPPSNRALLTCCLFNIVLLHVCIMLRTTLCPCPDGCYIAYRIFIYFLCLNVCPVRFFSPLSFSSLSLSLSFSPSLSSLRTVSVSSSIIMTTTTEESEALQPYFDFDVPRNLTVTVGQTGFLHCRVERLGDQDVSTAASLFSNMFRELISFYLSLAR